MGQRPHGHPQPYPPRPWHQGGPKPRNPDQHPILNRKGNGPHNPNLHPNPHPQSPRHNGPLRKQGPRPNNIEPQNRRSEHSPKPGQYPQKQNMGLDQGRQPNQPLKLIQRTPNKAKPGNGRTSNGLHDKGQPHPPHPNAPRPPPGPPNQPQNKNKNPNAVNPKAGLIPPLVPFYPQSERLPTLLASEELQKSKYIIFTL